MRRSSQSSEYLQTSAREALAVLWDAERYAEWIPWIRSCAVLARDEDELVVELVAPAWSEHKILVELQRHDLERVSVRELGRIRDRGIVAELLLVAEADGGVTVSVRTSVHASGLAWGLKGRVEQAVAQFLHAVDVRVQRAALGLLPEPSQERRKVLEVRRSEQGLELWIEGETVPLRARES